MPLAFLVREILRDYFPGVVAAVIYTGVMLPPLLLLLAAWRYPRTVGEALLLIGTPLALGALTAAPWGLTRSMVLVGEALFLMPPVVAGLLLLLAGRAEGADSSSTPSGD